MAKPMLKHKNKPARVRELQDAVNFRFKGDPTSHTDGEFWLEVKKAQKDFKDAEQKIRDDFYGPEVERCLQRVRANDLIKEAEDKSSAGFDAVQKELQEHLVFDPLGAAMSSAMLAETSIKDENRRKLINDTIAEYAKSFYALLALKDVAAQGKTLEEFLEANLDALQKDKKDVGPEELLVVTEQDIAAKVKAGTLKPTEDLGTPVKDVDGLYKCTDGTSSVYRFTKIDNNIVQTITKNKKAENQSSVKYRISKALVERSFPNTDIKDSYKEAEVTICKHSFQNGKGVAATIHYQDGSEAKSTDGKVLVRFLDVWAKKGKRVDRAVLEYLDQSGGNKLTKAKKLTLPVGKVLQIIAENLYDGSSGAFELMREMPPERRGDLYGGFDSKQKDECLKECADKLQPQIAALEKSNKAVNDAKQNVEKLHGDLQGLTSAAAKVSQDQKDKLNAEIKQAETKIQRYDDDIKQLESKKEEVSKKLETLQGSVDEIKVRQILVRDSKTGEADLKSYLTSVGFTNLDSLTTAEICDSKIVEMKQSELKAEQKECEGRIQTLQSERQSFQANKRANEAKLNQPKIAVDNKDKDLKVATEDLRKAIADQEQKQSELRVLVDVLKADPEAIKNPAVSAVLKKLDEPQITGLSLGTHCVITSSEKKPEDIKDDSMPQVHSWLQKQVAAAQNPEAKNASGKTNVELAQEATNELIIADSLRDIDRLQKRKEDLSASIKNLEVEEISIQSQGSIAQYSLDGLKDIVDKASTSEEDRRIAQEAYTKQITKIDSLYKESDRVSSVLKRAKERFFADANRAKFDIDSKEDQAKVVINRVISIYKPDAATDPSAPPPSVEDIQKLVKQGMQKYVAASAPEKGLVEINNTTASLS